MGAQDEIRSLDDALSEVGTDCVLRRTVGVGANAAHSDVTVRAMVRYGRSEQFTPGVLESDVSLIMSPTQILAAQWPGGQPAGPDAPYDAAAWLPREGDRLIVLGRECSIINVTPVPLDNAIVRIEITAAG